MQRQVLFTKKEFKKILKNEKKALKERKKKDKQELSKDDYVKKYTFNTNDSDYIIYLNDLSKYYKEGKNYRLILDRINLKLKQNKIISIVGPSGTGKSTVFNLISGIIQNETGQISVLRQNLKALSEKERTFFRKQHIGFIFQEYNLLNTLTNRDNILLGSDLLSGESKNQIKEELKEVTHVLGIENLLDKYPNQISGGQKQRVAIARTLIKKPKIILADEPTGALDTVNTAQILDLLRKINRELKTTILIITHSNEVAQIGDVQIKIVDGKIQAIK